MITSRKVTDTTTKSAPDAKEKQTPSLKLEALNFKGKIHRPSYFQQISFHFSNLFRPAFTTIPLCHHISDGLFLSRIPKKDYTQEHLDIVSFVNSESRKPLGGIFSIVENWELNGADVWNTVKPTDWQELGIKPHQFPTPDGKMELQFKTISHILSLMHTFIQNNQSVLVHCKGGMARSAFFVILYVMLYSNETKLQDEIKSLSNIEKIKAVERFVADKRKCVKLEENQQKIAAEFIEYVKHHPLPQPSSAPINRNDDTQARVSLIN
jgi:protein-tyrosine phosphatase